MYLISSLTLWLSTLILLGCSKSEDKAAIPMYVDVEATEVTTRPTEGSGTHLITEAWVYADSILLGAFPIPSRVPLIGEGVVTLDIFAGIRENGLAASIGIYPFYNSYQYEVDFEELKIVSIVPVFTYEEGMTIALIEGFEQSNIFQLDLDTDPDTKIRISSEGSLDGGSGVAELTSEHPILEVASDLVPSVLPSNGAPVYLELDYKSVIPFSVGTRQHGIASSPMTIYKLVLFPDDEWQKIYVNFTEDIRRSNASGYQIVFQSFYDSSISQEAQTIHLDNIKLLHF